MSQHAWLELDRGMWRLVTHIRSKPTETSRKWADKKSALQELQDEGWTITGSYSNWLSRKLKLNQKIRGYGLIRTVHSANPGLRFIFSAKDVGNGQRGLLPLSPFELSRWRLPSTVCV